ncbi:MAG: mononuclear molybdenum enzyme YedY [Candidatus Lambdaproteobacteria bacterium RIFOXYD1_FULL_56_27]|uniref:Protein-methionine-sulfoxide reductase catalytic subunit MsrP n=1 Tax=Candidatus Lambdaproteobacteria bacterium RIFOXYD2_FULL_56_26 TaxID=1817773 RepID=A0A1F6GRS1_9PROT|nr:MAG: mononuclear molybdenum enzyme YedY [Candidatus Lambdaproteobacteria bacterium RIFOXYC1_FULL_56_13]OGH00794.1 MAG: mononuclear molybdenum enzyme YedY [Candidatus Lambdaproteobacteria bacterium RIFOXYD2_FULL_56_26]OGH09941.1 MAG: mononuclear molybdenum enzyme YedY [Candidatus Lambdaproteobacteria bacterium RIFOXYD1_FULL_56_27]
MKLLSKPSWQLPESAVTEEQVFVSRRALVKGLGLALAWPGLSPMQAWAAKFGSELTPSKEELVTSYNNFYEFSTDKGEVRPLAQGVQLGPWELEIGGLVEKPLRLDTQKLAQLFGEEERIYRFRCVEAWAAVVPWRGVGLKKLVEMARPLSGAKYVRFVAHMDPKVMPGLASGHFPWPYSEGLRIDEATHELAFLATGIYGKPLPTQNGAPVRLVVPWKYGFKSIKSIRSIEFTATQPRTLWNDVGPAEYGFYANVNPEVDHPRWSQATEKLLGSWVQRQPTRLFNGYGEQVASLYQGLDLKRNY